MMADIQTHADVAAPLVIGFVSSLTVFMFDQPPAVFITAAGAALWAIYRRGKYSFWRDTASIIAATFTACAMVSFAVWLLALIGAPNAPVRGVAGLIAFLIIDKVWRDKVLVFIGVRLEGVGK
jgi:hypothetical protein